MRRQKILKTIIGIVTVALACVAVTAITAEPTAFEEKAFFAGEDCTVAVYQIDEHGDLHEAKAVPRGTAFTITEEEPVEFDGAEYRRGYLSADESREVYFADSASLTGKKIGVVREKELYARTPATMYANSEGPEIAGFVPKGTKLNVTGFAGLDDEGIVAKYKVQIASDEEDPDSETPAEGYVYGKYLVRTREEADANYNENGEYDKAKKSKYGMELYGGKATDLDYYPYERTEIEGKEFCKEARGMYLNWYAALHNDEYIKLIKKTGCNAVVIDIKDGGLTYKSPAAKELSPTSYKKAHVSPEEFQEVVKKFNDEGIYTIGRIACFSDSQYAKDHPEDCIKTGVSGSAWPSAYSRDVWYYNVALATEAVRLMDFDEIQFDYVRFPEQAYEMSKDKSTKFRNSYGESKVQAIQNFCFYAADSIHEAGAYFSVDVFGECSNGYVTACGQYWPGISNIVDAISSMPYTDHFGKTDTWSEPKAVMSAWAKKAAKEQKKIPTPAVARTWITGYNTPHWAPSVTYDEKKLREQVDALYEAGLDGGFIPWHSASPIDTYRMYKGIWNYERK
ncbi:MAG: putative glycoside hydrolase [Bacillota bacterium]